MKFYFCQNDRNEITPAMSFISEYFMKTVVTDSPDNKLKIFHFARNETLCKHSLKLERKNISEAIKLYRSCYFRGTLIRK